MPKKQRRVSFRIPEKEADEEEDKCKVNIAIVEDPIDEDVETVGDSGSRERHSDSDDSISEDSSDEATSDEDNSIREEGSKPARRARKNVAGNEEHASDPGSDSDDAPAKHSKKVRRGSKKTSDSEGHSSSEEGSTPDASDAHSVDGSELNSKADSGSDSNSSESGSESDSSDDESNVDEPETGGETNKQDKAPTPISTFSEMGLDPRVERAIERCGWRKPTPVQAAVIPAAMAGRDVLVSAPTGSGKTATFAIPVVQQICRSDRSKTSAVQCVILVPTRELVHQVTAVVKRLCKYIDGIHVGSLAGKDGKKSNREVSFSRASDILVATPSSLKAATSKDEKNALSAVDFIVVDEADLVLSYGYMNDAREVLSKIPTTAQSMLLSATLEGEGMDNFRKLVLRRPLTIKVTADDNVEDGEQTGATHYYARLKNYKDRYLVTYAMLRLNVICGKVLIFVNHINTAFRLKLFLDQFKLKSAVLNSELPANSRIHCVEQFNAGLFEILIATDESRQDTEESKKKEPRSKKVSKKRKRIEKDEEFGLSRGVDFRDVAAVFNFDMPETASKYTHRAGRTARAGSSGTVLTLVCEDKEEMRVLDMGRETGTHVGPLAFRMEQIESLRYRVESSLRLVTDTAVHGARLADVRREIVNSDALKDYFEDNPQDLDALQHNLSLAKNIPEHLGHIPSYLLPPALRKSANNEMKGKRFKAKRRRTSRPLIPQQKRQNDPLKSFSTSGVGGSSRDRYRTKHGIKVKKADLGRTMKKRKRTYKV